MDICGKSPPEYGGGESAAFGPERLSLKKPPRLLVTKEPLFRRGRDSDRQSVRTSPLPFKPLSFDEEATAEAAAARKKLISALGEKI